MAQGRDVGSAAGGGLRQGVVALQHHAAGAKLAVGACLRARQRSEGAEDVVGVVPRNGVEVEKGGVKFALEPEASVGVPDEGRPVIAAVTGEGLEIPGGVGQFQDAGE